MSHQALYLNEMVRASRVMNRMGLINKNGYRPPGSIPYAEGLQPLEAANLPKHWSIFNQKIDRHFLLEIIRVSVQNDGSAFVNTSDKRLFYLINVNGLLSPNSSVFSPSSSNLFPTPPMTPTKATSSHPLFFSSPRDSCEPIEIVEFSGVDVRSIIMTDNYFAVLSCAGEMLYICMNIHNYIKCRLANLKGSIYPLYNLNIDNIVQSIDCSDQQYLLNHEGDVYKVITGVNDDRLYAFQLKFLVKIAKIASGPQRALGLSFNGKLFGWSSKSIKQANQNDRTYSVQPVLLFEDYKFFDVSTSGNHVLLLCANGDIWELGFRNGLKQERDLKKIIIKNPVNQGYFPIKAVMNHTRYSMAQAFNGTIYAWGDLAPLGYSTNEPQALPGVYRHLADAYGQFALDLPTEADGLMLELWYDRKFKPFDEAYQINDPKTCDITFKFNNQLLHAHRRIIRHRSSMIENLLIQPGRYTNQKFVINDIDYQVFAQYLCYLYDGYVHNLDDSTVFPLMLFADSIGEKELFNDCVHYLETKMMSLASCVCAFYEIVDQFKLKRLERKLRLLLLSNLDHFINTSGWNIMDGKLKHFLLRQANQNIN